MPTSNLSSSAPDSVEARAAEWLAQRDRGLSEREQAAYVAWLREDPRHAAAIARLEAAWDALDRLAVHRPAGSAAPDPDLLSQRRWSPWLWSTALAAAAAAVMLISFTGTPPAKPTPGGQAIVHPGPERLTLADGSVVELNAGAKIDVQFAPGERRVRLVRGEAYFTVTRNPNRPFIVSASDVTVRAVGTAFSVGIERQEISVLVTEGRVRVDEARVLAGEEAADPCELSALVAGQKGVIPLGIAPATGRLEMTVTTLTPAEVERALRWQVRRLEFVDMPLGAVVTEFNRYNRQRLVVRDAETAAILVGGNFRADNVDAFVRLLDSGFGVSAFPHSGEIVLRKTRAR